MLILVLSINAYGQINNDSTFISSNATIEKIHLHLDKPYYAAGETIWIKGYVVDELNRPSLISQVLYINLINDSGKLVSQLTLPLNSGTAYGDIPLMDTITQGTYWLQAYTKNIQNHLKETTYERIIAIGNPLSDLFHTSFNYTFSTTSQNLTKVSAELKCSNSANPAISGVMIKYKVTSGKDLIIEGNVVTNNDGTSDINFLTDIKTKELLILHAELFFQGKKYYRSFNIIQKDIKDFHLQFFPEGGFLLDSIRSKVAFKAINTDGLGTDITGYVVDEQGLKVAELKSEKFGIGSFLFTPYRDNYIAVVNSVKGEQRFNLPEAKSHGMILSLFREDETNLYLRVMASNQSYIAHNKQIFTISAGNRSEIFQTVKFKVNSNVVNLAFPKKDLPNGITQLTLLNQEGIPISERLVFLINPKRSIRVNLEMNKNEFKLWDKVKINLSTLRNNKPIAANLSLSVINESIMPIDEKDEHSILSNLLLTSDLKGYIEHPNYYFLDSSSYRKRQLDNLILSQGWRKISVKPLDKSHPQDSITIDKGLTIGGTVTLKNKILENAKVTLFSPEKGIYLDTLTNNKGKFIFDRLVFQGDLKFLIQATTASGKTNAQIHLDNDDIQPSRVSSYPNLEDHEEELTKYLKINEKEISQKIDQIKRLRTIMLDEVIVRSDPKDRISSKLGVAPADYTFNADQLEGGNLGAALGNKVPGMSVNYAGTGGFSAAYMLRNQLLSGSSPMRLFIDGADMGVDLGQVDMNTVYKVEVIKGGSAIYGNAGFNGVIIVTTKMAAGVIDPPTVYSDNNLSILKKGYSIVREFYSPEYETVRIQSELKDERSTLFWRPNLLTSINDKLSLEFFTSDRPGVYRILIEGLDQDGNLIRHVDIFNIKD